MSLSFFLGANTKDGFYSLYDGFTAGPGNFLHIIKSGPGTGKSRFMRAIGRAAEQRGLETQYILCSGDPSSLDGVFIPRLGEGWVDGTAPHVTEPRHFGFDSDYVNFGSFFSPAGAQEDIHEVMSLTGAYKSCFSRAYSYLRLAADADLSPDAPDIPWGDGLRQQLRGILSEASTVESPPRPCCRQIFISAICCDGRVVLTDSIKALCKLQYSIEGGGSYVDTVLGMVLAQAQTLGLETLPCLSPLDPTKLEALVIPALSLGFVSGELKTENAVPLMAQSSLPAPAGPQRRAAAIRREALTLAIGQLREAKSLHDRLEAHYTRRMDFPALTAYTEEVIEKAFPSS